VRTSSLLLVLIVVIVIIFLIDSLRYWVFVRKCHLLVYLVNSYFYFIVWQ